MDMILINIKSTMSLDQTTAQRRANLIRQGSIQYNYHIIVEADKYYGLAQITFYLKTMNFQHELELDFSGESVVAVIINNTELDAETTDNFIILPRNYLQKGKNRVSVLYQNVYDIDLSGLVSFVDSGDQFLFTDFEPYYANRVFPCFDQPNLKATMKLAVVTPSNWKVISHETPNPSLAFSREKYIEKSKWIQSKASHLITEFADKVKADTVITTFPETKPLSTYLFCFCAGNYASVTTQQVSTVPMTLFCPPSVIPILERYSEFIYDVTIKCMAFFAQKFQTPYPFNKYDQIFIKECHALAMENAGIVTFNEPYLLPKDVPTQYDYYYMALVVSHELSHHWFGNYVTMVWWDDLWLNQSFAEWISCYSIEKLLTTLTYKFDSSYLYFRDGKVSGYEEDQRNSATHPIRGTVNNTEEAMSIFDGITYQKGASALKQLTYLVGEDNFCQAVSNYFARFAWGNATIDDLIVDITAVYKNKEVNLQDWKRTWLETESLNVFFTTNWDTTKKQFTLNQRSFDDKNVLRVHKMEISLFTQKGQFTVLPNQLISPLAQTTITYIDPTNSVKAILINHGDYTFIENIIDPVSLQFFKANIDKITDLLARGMVWYNIRSMVNISYFPVLDYVALIEDKLFKQQNNFIFEMILKNLLKCLTNFVASDIGKSLRSKIFGVIYQQLINIADTEKERIQILSDCYIKFGNTEEEILKLELWLKGTDAGLSKRTLSNLDQKWEIVKKIFTLNRDTTEKWLTFESVKNQDFNQFRIGELQTICKAFVATEAQFDAIYNEFRGTDVSLTEKTLKVEGWRNQYHYDWIFNKYRNAYFNDIVELSTKLSYEEFEFFYENLRPIDDQLADQIDKYNSTIAKLEEKVGMEQHCKNLRKIVDDLSARIKNIAYNADINTALTQVRAQERFKYIKEESISYNSHIAFVKDDIYYTGMTEITFTLNSVPTYLPLDCICDTIYSLNVNGKEVYPNWNAQFVFIHSTYLVKGENFISIHYRNKYNNDGLGCMFYLETVTTPNNQYVYTKFQPYGAHRFFPCFDQPDLKAPITFNVIFPDGWVAAANEKTSTDGMAFTENDYLAKAPTKDQGLLKAYLANKAGKFSVFDATKSISTYLYCVVAGNYFSITATPDKLHNNIPMTLYSIQSYSDSLTRLAPFIFEMTTLSLDLYEKKFVVKYPFTKYDSVFCHQFKSGAMQNVGIITFNDTYLYPDEVSVEKMLQFASTIVHENSHNWFGNYVTMKWWDDLWLNESFADFIAHYCLETIKDSVTTIKYDSGWKIFLVRGVAGYREDQITETTHAVRSPVANTSIASTYFDRITYQKGSATLKQLMFLMGQDNFFLGVQDYFKKFGFKNGTIDNFLASMQLFFPVVEFSLDDWKKSWLLTPSLNTVSVEFDPADISEKTNLTIQQNWYTQVYPTLRYHKTRVAFFKQDASYDVLDVTLGPYPTKLLQYKGSNLYKAVLVNVDYWDYFKYTIDPISLEFFKKNLDKINNVLTRMIIWHDINEQVRDSSIRVEDFVAFFIQYIYTETDDKIFEFEYSFIRDALNNYIPIGLRPGFKKQIYDQTLKALLAATLPNRIKLLKDQLTVFADPSDPLQVTELEDWRNGSSLKLQAFPITSTQGWEVVKIIYSVSDPNEYSAEQKLLKYKDQESHYPGIKAQLTLNTCNTIIADTAGLSTVYGYFTAMDLSLDAKASFSQGWNNMLHLNDLTTIYKKKYFSDLPLLSKKLISNHFEFFYQNLKPIDDNLQETIDGYSSINLEGGDMIGHMKVLTQIKYMYQLRSKLYAFNS